MTIHELATTVLHRTGVPRDEWEMTAQLEVMGLRDADAAAYGARDLIDLGRQLHAQMCEGGIAIPPAPAEIEARATPLRDFLRHYATGLIFAVPMLLQAAAILLWGYGLWGARDVDVRTGTAIALGFVGSYVLTGGFVQAITRRGLFYISQGEREMARWVVLRGVGIALRLLFLLLIPAGFAANALYGWLPWDLLLVATVYYVSLTLLWLTWSIVYLSGGRHRIALVTAVALALVVALAGGLHRDVIVANTIGLLFASAASFVIGLRSLGGLSAPEPQNPPRLTILVHATSRWFLYGLLYNAFIFTDRIVAWTAQAGREDLPPYSFWLSARYELGLDLALVVVMLLSGAVEAAVQTFSEQLVRAQKSLRADERDAFATRFLRFHLRRTLLLVPFALVAIAIARGGVGLVAALPDDAVRTAMTSHSAMIAFWLAAPGYALLMAGVQNLLFLLTLSRVELAVQAVSRALVVNLAVGFMASRAVHYAGAAAGLTAGAAVLFVLTWRSVRRVGARLDYFHYAAY